MRRSRVVPIIGMSLAMLVAAPLAHAEPVPDATETATATTTATVTMTTEPVPDPTPTSEPVPEPAPTSDPVPEPEPPPTTTPPPPPPTTTPPPPPPTTSPPTTSTPSTSTPTVPRTTSPTTSRPSPSQVYTPPPSPWTTAPDDAVAHEHHDDTPLSPRDVSAQLAEADALIASLTRGNAEMAALLAKLQAVTKDANDALEAKAAANETSRLSLARAASSRATAVRLAEQLAAKHQQLRDWAFSAYSDGGSTAEMVSVFDALLNDPAEAGNPVGDLAYLTEERIRLFDDIRDLTERQAEAAQRAQEESAAAQEAAGEAARATAAAEKALEAQRAAVAEAQEEHASTLQEAAPLAAVLLGMSSPEAKARGEALLKELTANNIELPEIDQACSDDDGVYPNGQLPASALCPLWMADGEFAIPSASVAFNALSQRFAEDFGRPICVTDSYRSFSQQVAVKATRGFWAAPPGTSNHGLGKALDLCGGINSFGTIEHLWMKQNAPLFGWFHPSWAAADGRKPEPWHWEFAG
ncbi:MAG: D-alanyl-D-alanine carboxypeptidase family protein [Dermatophilaceae bacterium]